MLNILLNIFMNKELVFIMIFDPCLPENAVSVAAILKFKMAAINGIFSLASTLKMLRIALSSFVQIACFYQKVNNYFTHLPR